MSTDFDAFLSNQKANDVDAVQKGIQAQNGANAREVDPRFYDFSKIMDKDGNGRAVVRLLPAPDSTTPLAKITKHSWRRQVNGQTRYYIENSRKTIGLADPVADYNGKIFDLKLPKDEQKKRLVPRTFRYIANITFIENDADPESVGKVFLWDFGGQINEIYESKLFPKHPKDPKMDAFNLLNGANLIVRIYKKDVGDQKLPQYDNSEFESPGPISTDTAVLRAIFEKLYPIKPFLEESNFKSYEELEKQLMFVLGESDTGAGGQGQKKAAEPEKAAPAKDEGSTKDSIPFEMAAESAPQASTSSSSEDDDWFSQFKK